MGMDTNGDSIILAHINKLDEHKYIKHSLKEHSQETAIMAAAFASSFDSSDWAFNSGLIHDLGKADSAFQGYLLRVNELDDSEYDTGRVNHSSAGAAFSYDKFGIPGKIISYIIAGHHAGLPDWYSSDTGNAALSIRLNEGRKNLERVREYENIVAKQLKNISKPPEYINPSNLHFWIRMIYSCLVDADFLDTEKFMNQEQSLSRTGFKDIRALKFVFDSYLSKLTDSAPRSNVNVVRQEILSACRDAANLPSGMFSLSVPTGGGKTLSSMAFALDHAVKHGKNRIIYVIPYTSIIEQTADTFADIFGKEQVVEHHSNLAPEKETPRSNLASENWDAPIIVTTNVQFFESLYAAKSSRCRKLHNLVNSVVILDEAQLLPPALLSPCVTAMNQLVKNYKNSIILSTATQPALPELDNVVEIIPPNLNLYARLKRADIKFPQDKTPADWSTIAERLKSHTQVLCIVNTRKDCYDLFKLMPDDTIHLSALMCGQHRSTVIAKIKQLLKKGEPLRVISTQLVEAGVDIDFPVVYRAVAGLDSIAQAAGRCNREGKLTGADIGLVYVFIPPGQSPPGMLLKGEQTTFELLSLPEFLPDSPETYTRYFNLFYNRVNDTGKKLFYDLLVKDVNPDINIQFRTANANFNLINDSANCPVIVRYNNNDKLINLLKLIGPTRDNMRQLQRCIVNLPVRLTEQMKNNGLIEVVHDSILIQTMPNLYSDKIGLDVFRENLPIEDLIQ